MRSLAPLGRLPDCLVDAGQVEPAALRRPRRRLTLHRVHVERLVQVLVERPHERVLLDL